MEMEQLFFKVDVMLLSPFKVKTGVLALNGDYSGLFLSKKYVLEFPFVPDQENPDDIFGEKNWFKSLRNVFVKDLMKYQKEFLKSPEIIVDYGETDEKQEIKHFQFMNQHTRLETGFVNFGEVEGVFIRGDNLFGEILTESENYSEELKNKIKQLKIWKDNTIDV